jgi:hypothetical protein
MRWNVFFESLAIGCSNDFISYLFGVFNEIPLLYTLLI